jgi:glyceraldehyde 3-phosphate dehydrogenase
MKKSTTVRVGINGFGQIGRNYIRALQARGTEAGVEVVAINDLIGADSLAYALQYDSDRGRFAGRVAAAPQALVINDRSIPVFNFANPGDIPWREAGVEVVIEATGQFRDGNKAREHILKGGAKKVIISASAVNVDAFIVRGVNEDDYDPAKHEVVSTSSCIVNASGVLAAVLLRQFGIVPDSTTVFCALPTRPRQQARDAPSNGDMRMGRASGNTLVPFNYNIGKLLAAVAPELGRVQEANVITPVSIGSVVVLTARTKQAVSAADINKAMSAAARGGWQGLLEIADGPIVARDSIGSTASCIFDPAQTTVEGGNFVKLVGFFDNEWGYPNRLISLSRRVIGADLAAMSVG